MRKRLLTALLAATVLFAGVGAEVAQAGVQRATAAVMPLQIIGEDFPDPDVFDITRANARSQRRSGPIQ